MEEIRGPGSSGRRELAAQARLAAPVVAVQIGLFAMGAVDQAFLGRVSTGDFAAVSLGNAWSFAFIVFGMGLLTVLDPLISQAFGAGDEVAIRRGIQRGLLLALVVSVPVSLGILPARPVLAWLGQPPEIVPLAAAYARITIVSVPAFLLFVALRQSLQAMALLRPLLVVILLANLLNALLDWAWILGHLGFPALGARGAAWATVVARWFLTVALLVLTWRRLAPYLRARDPRLFVLAPLLRMARVGLPVGMQFVLEIGAFSAVLLLMGGFGQTELAGHQVALTLASASFMVPLGISMAASVRVGHAVGRGDAAGARLASRVALLGGAGVMCLFGALFLLLPLPLASLVTDLPEVLAVAVLLIPLAGLFQVFDGTQVVASGVLRGVADTRVAMVLHFVGFWLVGIPVGFVLARPLGLGPTGLWWGLVAGLAATAVALTWRVRLRLSRDLARLHVEGPEEAPPPLPAAPLATEGDTRCT